MSGSAVYAAAGRLRYAVVAVRQPIDPDDLEIGAIVFRCPQTHRHVSSGILIEHPSLIQIEELSARFACKACGHHHTMGLRRAHWLPLGTVLALDL